MNKRLYSRRRFVQTAAAAGTSLLGSRGAAAGVVKERPAAKPALLEGEPVRTDPFPVWPFSEKVDEDHLLDALKRGEWCRLSGDIATRFEEKWAEMLGVRYATGVVNGTNALYAALNALEVGPGDEVIVPPYTFVATVNAVIQQFALPVFADTDPLTFQIDPSRLDAVVTANTRCIMPVHLGGSVADMDGIAAVAEKHGLSVVEDACQAHFAEWGGRRVGGLGDIGCFSFQASKILPCGEGGAIVTNREDLLDRFHAFQNNGRDRKTGTRSGYQHQGSNLRITEFQAALLLAQLTRFEETCRHREENAAYLTEMLTEIPGITPAQTYEKCTRNTYYLYMLAYDQREFEGLSRRRFLQALQKEGIPVGSGYRPLNEEPFLKKTLNSSAYRRIYSSKRLEQYWERNRCPQNDQLCEVGIFLGQRCLLGQRRDTEQVAEAIRKIRAHAGDLAKT